MKRVLFLYNGGTIGQVVERHEGKPILVPPKNSDLFKLACKPIIDRMSHEMEIDYEFITSKDSTNILPTDWERLILRIRQAQDEDYDAVAIVHGTDTMAYTSTAIALGLHGKDPSKSSLRIPVCITGAQNSIFAPGGDAKFNLGNLFRTVDEAMRLEISDVLVNFWDHVLLGCRVVKTSEKRFDAIQSPSYPDVGHIDSTGVHLDVDLVRRNYPNGTSIAPKFAGGVVSFELSPGIDPKMVLNFLKTGEVSALVLKSLGEGNVCSEGPYNIIPVIKKATEELNLPIFITTKIPGASAVSLHYEGGYQAIKAGGIPCYDHTDVATDVKVRWLLGNNICSKIGDFREAMKTNFAGEVTPPTELPIYY